MPKAWLVKWKRMPGAGGGVRWADTSSQARYRTMRKILDLYPAREVDYRDFTAVRAKRLDNLKVPGDKQDISLEYAEMLLEEQEEAKT